MILMHAIAAQRELHIGLEGNVFVTQRCLLAEEAVIRPRAERQLDRSNC